MASSLADLVAAEIARPWFQRNSDELRRLYDARREKKRCAQAGTAIGILTLFYMSCFGLDLVLIPDVWKLSIFTRLIATPIIGGAAFAYSRRGPGRMVDIRNAVAIILSGLLWSIQLLLSQNQSGVLSYLTLSPSIIIAVTLVCSMPFRTTLITSIIVFVDMSWVIYVKIDIEHYFVIADVFQLFWLAVLTLVVNWRTERGRMRLFLSRLTSDLQQQTIERSNVELLRLSRVDALTGVANRRSADIALNERWQAWTVDGDPFALILLDVDFFKSFNDGYGHYAGDQCLIAVARAMADVVAAHAGFIGRFGGEEFIVLARFESVETVVAIAASLRLAVRRAAIEHCHRGDAIDVVTISGGIALCADGARPEALVKSADAAPIRPRVPAEIACACSMPRRQAWPFRPWRPISQSRSASSARSPPPANGTWPYARDAPHHRGGLRFVHPGKSTICKTAR